MGKKDVEKHSSFMFVNYFTDCCCSSMARSKPRLNQPIVVVLHPINADGLQTTQSYIHQLHTDFERIRNYLAEWSQHYRGQSGNFVIRLGQPLQRPPEVPQNANIFHVMRWSLKFRFYAWRHQQPEDNGASLKLYSITILIIKSFDPFDCFGKRSYW